MTSEIHEHHPGPWVSQNHKNLTNWISLHTQNKTILAERITSDSHDIENLNTVVKHRSKAYLTKLSTIMRNKSSKAPWAEWSSQKYNVSSQRSCPTTCLFHYWMTFKDGRSMKNQKDEKWGSFRLQKLFWLALRNTHVETPQKILEKPHPHPSVSPNDHETARQDEQRQIYTCSELSVHSSEPDPG